MSTAALSRSATRSVLATFNLLATFALFATFTLFATCTLLATCAITAPSRAWASDADEAMPGSARGRTLALFDEVARADRGFSLRAWVNDGSSDAIPIGSDLAYHFVSERAAHLIALHVDPHGVATLLLPNGVPDPGGPDAARTRLAAEVPRAFPSPDDDFTLRAEPPVGRENVLVIATARPIGTADMGLAVEPDAFVVREAVDAPALASRLLELYLETPIAERAAVHLEQYVTGRPGASEYTSVDIVDYFTTRTRSIARPRLDLHIHFASNSDALDLEARRGLDEVAEALSDPRLREMRFTVAGHTDDTGTADYNQGLSRDRAGSVVRYLSEVGGIDASRLEIAYHGESRPLESNATREGRRMNRRVEFELLR